MSKIFCVGLNKTGTSSLHKAFEVLGLDSVHFRDSNGGNIKKIIRDNYLNGDDILKGLEHYEAFSDWDGLYSLEIVKEFDKQYPGSKFILNIRDLDDWLDSRERHVKRNQEMQRKNPNRKYSWLKVNRERWVNEYCHHYNGVIEHFGDREDELLIFDVTKGDGWEKLCPFLNVSIPSIPFPKENVAK